MTQGHASHRAEPDDDLPPLPSERAAPPVPAGAVPVLDEEDPPDVGADDIPAPADADPPEVARDRDDLAAEDEDETALPS